MGVKPTSNEPSAELPEVESVAPLKSDALDIVEVVGSIKWFDASKGYGFIVPDNGMPDVLLHVTCLRAGGYQTAYEGAKVHCQALKQPKGLQAFHIVSMDEADVGFDPQ